MASPDLHPLPEVQAPLVPQVETRTYLDLVRTHGCLTTRSGEVFKPHGITEQQYYVLRILDETEARGLPCLEIARQLPTPAPDVTRLLDRMLRAGLVTRERDESDRRVVMAAIGIETETNRRQFLPGTDIDSEGGAKMLHRRNVALRQRFRSLEESWHR